MTVLSTKPRILFCDLKLHPEESKSCKGIKTKIPTKCFTFGVSSLLLTKVTEQQYLELISPRMFVLHPCAQPSHYCIIS